MTPSIVRIDGAQLLAAAQLRSVRVRSLRLELNLRLFPEREADVWVSLHQPANAFDGHCHAVLDVGGPILHASNNAAVAEALGWRLHPVLALGASSASPVPAPEYRWVSPDRARVELKPDFLGDLREAVATIPAGVSYTMGKGQTRPDEPPFGAVIWPGEIGAEEPIAEGEHEHRLEIAILMATLRLRGVR